MKRNGLSELELKFQLGERLWLMTAEVLDDHTVRLRFWLDNRLLHEHVQDLPPVAPRSSTRAPST